MFILEHQAKLLVSAEASKKDPGLLLSRSDPNNHWAARQRRKLFCSCLLLLKIWSSSSPLVGVGESGCRSNPREEKYTSIHTWSLLRQAAGSPGQAVGRRRLPAQAGRSRFKARTEPVASGVDEAPERGEEREREGEEGGRDRKSTRLNSSHAD